MEHYSFNFGQGDWAQLSRVRIAAHVVAQDVHVAFRNRKVAYVDVSKSRRLRIENGHPYCAWTPEFNLLEAVALQVSDALDISFSMMCEDHDVVASYLIGVEIRGHQHYGVIR